MRIFEGQLCLNVTAFLLNYFFLHNDFSQKSSVGRDTINCLRVLIFYRLFKVWKKSGNQ